MTDTFLADTRALLGRTPRVVRELLDGLPETWLDTPDTPDGWTPRDVVGHLISAELDDWIPRAEIILEHGPDKPFEPFDRFAHVERDKDVPLAELIIRFDQLRGESLARLRELVGEDDLDRVGRHPELGEVTLRQLLGRAMLEDELATRDPVAELGRDQVTDDVARRPAVTRRNAKPRDKSLDKWRAEIQATVDSSQLGDRTCQVPRLSRPETRRQKTGLPATTR